MSQFNFELGLQVETVPCDAKGKLVDESSFSEYRCVALKKIIHQSEVFLAKDLDKQDEIEAQAIEWLVGNITHTAKAAEPLTNEEK